MRDISYYFTTVSKEMHLEPQYITDLRGTEKKIATDAAEMKNDREEHARILTKFKRCYELREIWRQAIDVTDPVRFAIDVVNSLKMTIAEASARDSSFTASYLLGVM